MGAVLRGFAVFITILGLLAAGVAATYAAQLLTGGRRDDVLLQAAILYALGVFLVLFDWRRLGPAVALQSSLLAAAVAWLFIVPLGLVGLELVEAIPLAGFAALSVAVVITLYFALPPIGCLVGLIVASLLMYLSTQADSLVVDQAGTALVFAALHFSLRRAITVYKIEHWPDAQELDPESREFIERCAFFEKSCHPWMHKYPFRLSVQRIFRMRRANHRPVWAHARHLFHGTPWEAAYGIATDGFRLPDHPGMFGKGIYFADCPLKSWQYTKNLGENLMCCRRGGLILMCWVDLGEQRRESQANIRLGGYDRSSWWAWLTLQQGAYDSVVGLDQGQGGSLRVPEYVIYNPSNARVEYIFEVSTRPPGPAGE
mmetsp:Transcript_70663/g.206888  ORF Transcript_70663/g.206888 Transcript_70663/m.206888 type:complete len:372 (+) Transcript_70663:72-1187(+)